MVLSNTDTPKYYAEFRSKVQRGEIPICHELSMEMNRIESLIDNPSIYCDNDAVEGWVRFCESELTLTDGSDLHMLDTYKLWGEEVYAWYYFIDKSVYVPNKTGGGGHFVNKRIKKRLINTQYLIVGRSNAKTLYGECHQAFRQIINTETSQQITVAPTMKQADEIMSPYRTAIARSRGPVFRFLTMGKLPGQSGGVVDMQVKLASTKKGIQNFLTNSILEVRPMSTEKLQGLRPGTATIDEWLSTDIRDDVIEPVSQGAQKNDDWLIIAMSSEGTIRNSIGDTIKMRLTNILNGEVYDPHVSIFWYKQDNLDEIAHPELYMKSNPNVGYTISYETLQNDVAKMESDPSVRNDILAKRFGIPTEGYTFYFSYDETLPHRKQDYWQLPCAMGADLSQGDDFCSFTFMFPLRGETFGIKTRNYISEYTLSKLSSAARVKYDEFINEGSLHVMEGTVLDMEIIYDDLDDYISKSDYDVRAFGYDPYNAKGFVDRWTRENGDYGVTKVIQGARTESVPLGEIKKLAEDGRLLFDESIFSFAMGNCIALEDTNGNRKLLKARRRDKIDPVAAMLDAFIAYKLNRDAFE